MESKIINFNGLYLKFISTDGGLRIAEVTANGGAPKQKIGLMPFIISAEGESAGSTFGGFDGSFKNDKWGFKQTTLEIADDRAEITFVSEKYGCTVKTTYVAKGGAAAVYQTNTVTTEKDIVLTDFYSLLPLCGYASGDNERYSVLYRRNRWQTEGQWYENTLKEAGFNVFCKHVPMNRFTVSGGGSQPTSEFYPCLLVKDKETGEIWLIESKVDGSWFERISEFEIWDDKQGALLVTAGTLEERTLKSRVLIKAGESFSTPPLLISAASSEAGLWKNVYKAKRADTDYRMENAPLIFNDFMNCLWASPSWEKEKTLIDACAELGVNYFVIDDGWFNYREEIGNRFGDWNTDGDVFGVHGLKGVIDYIRSKGMQAGIWIEGEVVGENSKIYKEHPEYTLTVNGKSYGSKARHFLDFRKREAVEYLEKVYAELYSLGIRYIKTDYNDSYDQADSESGTANGLRENYRKIAEFYKNVKRNYPDLLTETCASGGKREDGFLLKHFDVQSVSDQEEYPYYPSIICGSLVNNVPEKTGVWCMPYPVRHHLRNAELDEVPAPSDEEVIFNVVNGLTGVVTLSSRVDRLNRKQTALLKEGLTLYPKIFGILKTGYPSYPLGLTRGEDTRHALRFESDRGELLFLWAIGENRFEFDGAGAYRQIYPSKADCEIGENSITLKSGFCARIFIKKQEK